MKKTADEAVLPLRTKKTGQANRSGLRLTRPQPPRWRTISQVPEENTRIWLGLFW